MLGMPPPGENGGSAGPGGAGERRGHGSPCCRPLGFLGNLCPEHKCLWWGGSGQGPLGSLAGSWGTGPVVGRQGSRWLGSPPSSAPHHPGLPWSLTSIPPPTGLQSAGTSPELMGPEPSKYRIQSSGPCKGLPGLQELCPAQPAPQDDRRIGTPVSCRRCQLPSASANAPPRPQVRPDDMVAGFAIPWAPVIILWGGGRGGGLTGESGDSRKAGGHGEALAWLPAIRGVS